MLDKYRTITYKNAKNIRLLGIHRNSAVAGLGSGLGEQIVDCLRLPGKKLFLAALCGIE